MLPVLAFADLDFNNKTPYLLPAVKNAITLPLAMPADVSPATTLELEYRLWIAAAEPIRSKSFCESVIFLISVLFLVGQLLSASLPNNATL